MTMLASTPTHGRRSRLSFLCGVVLGYLLSARSPLISSLIRAVQGPDSSASTFLTWFRLLTVILPLVLITLAWRQHRSLAFGAVVATFLFTVLGYYGLLTFVDWFW